MFISVKLLAKYVIIINAPWTRFSKVPIINGPGKLLLFTFKIEVSILLQINMIKLKELVCQLDPALLFFTFWFEYIISGQKSYRAFRETGPKFVSERPPKMQRFTLWVRMVTNINFLLTISRHCQESRLRELTNDHQRENALILY